MSGRYRNDDDTDGCVKALFGIIFIGGYFVINFLINFFRTPLYEKLRRLNQIAYWDTVIEAVVCPNCTASNEFAYVNCWSCNQLLTHSPQAKHLSKETTNTFAVEATPTVFTNKGDTEKLNDTVSASKDKEVVSPPNAVTQETVKTPTAASLLVTIVALIITFAVLYFFCFLASYAA